MKSSAMGVIPFKIGKELNTQLKEFQLGTINWVEMHVDSANEAVELVNSQMVSTNEDVIRAINTEFPRFIAYSRNMSTGGQCDSILKYFVYSCPEIATIRSKMMYSACKATVLARTAELGVKFDKTIEIREPSELVEVTNPTSLLLDPPLKTKMFAKPSYPVRGRTVRGRGSVAGAPCL